MSSLTKEPHVAPIESGAEQHVFDPDQLFAEMIKQLQGGGGGKHEPLLGTGFEQNCYLEDEDHHHFKCLN